MTVVRITGSSYALATGTSEITLANVGTPGRFQLIADLRSVASVDTVEFRVRKSASAADGAPKVVEYLGFVGTPSDNASVALSTPIPNADSWDESLKFTVIRTRGNASTINIDWQVVNLEFFPNNFTSLGISSLGHIQNVDLVGQVTGSAMSLVSGSAVSFDPALVWSFTGARALNGLQTWDRVGNTSGTYFGNISGAVGQLQTNLDKLGYGLINNQVVNFSGTITNVYNVLNPVIAGVVTGSVLGNVNGSVNNVVQPVTLVNNQVVNISGTITNVYNVLNDVHVSGTVLVNDVHVSGTVIADVRSLVGVSGTVVASVVQGGFVSVSGAVIADVRSLVGVSGTVIASAVQGGYVSVSGAVVADVRSLVGVSGTVVASVVQGGVVTVSGTVLASAVQGGFVTVSGTVVVGTNNDKTGYFLGSPQVYDWIGNQSGTNVGNRWGWIGQVTGSVMSVVSGSAATFDPALVWSFTGTRSLNGLQTWNLNGYVGQVTGSVMSVVSGSAASIDYAQVWAFTGTRSLNGLQTWNLNGYVGQVTGSVMSVVSGSAASIDYSQVWSFTGSRSLNGLQNWNLVGNITGTMTGVEAFGQTILDYVAMLAMDDHAVTGEYFYVEATNGNDTTGDGTRLHPYKTITKALSMTQAYRHDAVLLMPNSSGTSSLYQEAATIVVNKAYVQIIGVGADIMVQPTAGAGKDVFSITADGVGLHQFAISTNGNTSNGVTVSNGVMEALLHLLSIEDCSQDGIYLNVATHCMVMDTHIVRAGRDGIRINSGSGAGNYNTIEKTVIRACTINGINLLGADASNTRIQYCVVRGNGVGINVSAGTVASIIVDNRIVDNTVEYVDAGTSTHQEWNWFDTDPLGHVDAVYNLVSGSVVADRVWNYTGTRTVDRLRGLVGVSGTVVVSSGVVSTVFNVVSGTSASIDYSQIWSYTGARTLNGTQNWNLNGNFSGTIQPPITAVATGVAIDYASIWSYASRTLTDQVFNLPPVEQGNNLNIRRGDTFVWSPTNLGDISNLGKLYFTVKRLYTDPDTESEIQVEKTAGLLYINRASAATPANGSIVVNNAALGNITITVAAAETAKLDLLLDIFYDVQYISAAGVVTTLVSGLATIMGDSTRGTTP